MINLQLSVREAIRLATINGEDFREKIISAFEVALGVNQNRTVTITGGMTLDNRIYCIKAIRLHTGWGLKESKDWSDYLVGGWKYDKFVPAAAGAKNSVTLDTPEAAENLLRDLVDKGCEGFLS
jgi:hypothetical protein